MTPIPFAAPRQEGGSLIKASAILVRSPQAALNGTSMKILRVVGLGLAIVMLKFLVPRVFAGIENTLLAFFDVIQSVLATNRGFLPASVPSVSGL
jgi:hypothetical protein